MAELLGGEVEGVIGFDAVSSGRRHSMPSSALSAVGRDPEMEAASAEILYGDSSQFQVVLKQLGKRDTTTKLKVREGVFENMTVSISSVPLK